MDDPGRARTVVPAFDVVAIAASAGGLHALSVVLSGLPASFPAAILVVQHLAPHHRSLLADILSRRSVLHIKEARNGERVEQATVYVAPPNKHLLLTNNGLIALSDAAQVHSLRPSADLLFGSVAASCGLRAIAVVLTGTGSDGAAGIGAVKACGGTVLAQDEATSEYHGMPGAARLTGHVDASVPLEDIARSLMTLVRTGCLKDAMS